MTQDTFVLSIEIASALAALFCLWIIVETVRLRKKIKRQLQERKLSQRNRGTRNYIMTNSEDLRAIFDKVAQATNLTYSGTPDGIPIYLHRLADGQYSDYRTEYMYRGFLLGAQSVALGLLNTANQDLEDQ
jgi:hypothetical protein